MSTLALPSFDNSSMDGYAVRSVDVATAGPDAPVQLPVVGDIAAAQAQAGPAPLDGLILTETLDPQPRFAELIAAARQHGLPENRVVAPSLLGISPLPAVAGAAA